MFVIMFSHSTAFAHLWIDRYVGEEQAPTKSGKKTNAHCPLQFLELHQVIVS